MLSGSFSSLHDVLGLVPFALRDAFRSLSGCSSGRVPHWVDCKTAGGFGDCLSECPALVVIVRTLSGQLSRGGVVGKISGSPGQWRSLVSRSPRALFNVRVSFSTFERRVSLFTGRDVVPCTTGHGSCLLPLLLLFLTLTDGVMVSVVTSALGRLGALCAQDGVVTRAAETSLKNCSSNNWGHWGSAMVGFSLGGESFCCC